MGLVASVFAAVMMPTEQVTAADWLRQNFYTHDGRAFSEESVPWITAPQGPCWAYDNDQFRVLWLQWAARMFKTNFGLGMQMRRMDLRPGECMFATPDETNCKSVFDRWWKMLEQCPRLRDQVPIRQRQSKSKITLRRSVCHGAWPRGKSRLADKSIPSGHGNEIDKWVMEKTSTEGDPLVRFLKRGAEYPDRKFIMESTPSIRGKSSVEAGRNHSTNHRYQVPCPHCCKFQTIEFGDGSGPGMIHWTRPEQGHSDKELARRTAHYVCLHCEGRIDDIHRPWMMTHGVWVPAGCQVDHERAMIARELPPDDMSWLIGTPANWGSEYGSQISVFYAMFHGWGDIVYDYLSRCKTPAKLQQWVNEDKGETWEAKRSKTTPEKVGERLRTDVPRGVVPAAAKFMTVTIDRQAADGGFVKWVALAHDADDRSWLVDYGQAATLDALWDAVIRKQYPQTDALAPMVPLLSAADSGWDTKTTYDFCNTHERMMPCKGSNHDLGGMPYRIGPVESGEYEGQILFTVGTDFWETDLQACVDERTPGETGSLSLCVDAARDIELLQELCNATISDRMDSRGNAKLLWIKKDENNPNDWRDAIRYGRALGHLIVASDGVPKTPAARDAGNSTQSAFVRQPKANDDSGWIRRR